MVLVWVIVLGLAFVGFGVMFDLWKDRRQRLTLPDLLSDEPYDMSADSNFKQQPIDPKGVLDKFKQMAVLAPNFPNHVILDAINAVDGDEIDIFDLLYVLSEADYHLDPEAEPDLSDEAMSTSYIEGLPGLAFSEGDVEEDTILYIAAIRDFDRLSNGAMGLANLRVKGGLSMTPPDTISISFDWAKGHIDWTFNIEGKWINEGIFDRLGEIVTRSDPTRVVVAAFEDSSYTFIGIDTSDLDYLLSLNQEMFVLSSSTLDAPKPNF